jgi:hypothetical protein
MMSRELVSGHGASSKLEKNIIASAEQDCADGQLHEDK